MQLRIWAVALTWLVAMGATAPAWAGPAADQLKSGVDRVLQLLADPGLAGEANAGLRRAAIRKVAQEDVFDFPELARRSLGRHWQALDARQRDEFTGLFSDLLERAYVARIEQYAGERITYGRERSDGDLVTVPTRIMAKNGAEIPVDYRMANSGSRWRVYDVAIEGVSLVANYRTQFNKILQTGSFSELLQRLRTRQLEAASEKPAATRSTRP